MAIGNLFSFRFSGQQRHTRRQSRPLTSTSSLLDHPTSAEAEKGITRFSRLRFPRIPRMFGFRRVILSVLAVGVCVYFLFGLPHVTSPSKSSAASGWSLFGSGESEYCTSADFEQAYWTERPTITTDEEAMELYGLQSVLRWDCHLETRDNVNAGPNKARALALASPQLTLRRDCKKREWRYREAMIRLLRMPSGIFLIGDSLTKNAVEVYENLLVGPNTPILIGHGLLNGIPMWRNLTVKADHPSVPSLLAEAGVSIERLNFPLVTFLRADHLLPEKELSPIINAFTDHHSFQVLSFIEHYDWFKEMSDRLDAAEKTVIYAEGIKPEHSVVAFNTGPHWNTGELGARMEDEEFTEAYRRASLVLAAKMATIPQTLDVFWRAIAPGHSECGRYTKVNNNATSSEPEEEPFRIWYNYDQFPIWNDILREHFPPEPPAKPWWSSQPSKPHNWPRFLDTWGMSVKRGDAHFGPGWDCLHWCPIGVPDGWAAMMWHLMPMQNPEKK